MQRREGPADRRRIAARGSDARADVIATAGNDRVDSRRVLHEDPLVAQRQPADFGEEDRLSGGIVISREAATIDQERASWNRLAKPRRGEEAADGVEGFEGGV